jgi:hypothetical protein
MKGESTHLLPTTKRNPYADRREHPATTALVFRSKPELPAGSVDFIRSILGEAKIFFIIRTTPKYGDDAIFLVHKRAW